MPDSDLKQEDDLDLLISATAEAPAPVKKVELDLDDAPFLQADDKAPAIPAPTDVVPDAPDDDDAAKKRKKKLLIILGAALGAIIIAAVAVWWFFFRTPPPPPPSGPEPEIIVVPKTAAPVQQADIVREFAPFIVPVKGPDGKDGFLVCKFSAITHDANINREIDNQRVALRDAIYFYLRGKDNAFLLDARNGAQIKEDLLAVFNDYLTQGKLEDILFESYLGH